MCFDRGILFNITGGNDLTMFEVDEAARLISSEVDPDANIIFGAVIDERMADQVRITVIATEIDETRSQIGRMSRPTVMPQTQTTPLTQQPVNQQQPIVGTDEENVGAGEDEEKTEEKDEFDIPAFLRNPLNKAN